MLKNIWSKKFSLLFASGCSANVFIYVEKIFIFNQIDFFIIFILLFNLLATKMCLQEMYDTDIIQEKK